MKSGHSFANNLGLICTFFPVLTKSTAIECKIANSKHFSSFAKLIDLSAKAR